MKLHAIGNDLVIVERERLISGSVNIHKCEFEFDSGWDGYAATAVFSTGNRTVNMPIIGGVCDVPVEVLRPNAKFHVGIVGVSGDVTRPTIYSDWVRVEQGASTKGTTGKAPEQSVYEQWVAAVGAAADRAVAAESVAAESATAAQEAAEAALSAKDEAEHAARNAGYSERDAEQAEHNAEIFAGNAKQSAIEAAKAYYASQVTLYGQIPVEIPDRSVPFGAEVADAGQNSYPPTPPSVARSLQVGRAYYVTINGETEEFVYLPSGIEYKGLTITGSMSMTNTGYTIVYRDDGIHHTSDSSHPYNVSIQAVDNRALDSAVSEKADEAVSAAETALAYSSEALEDAREARNTASLALQDANRVASTAAEQAANQTASRLTSQMNQYVSAAQESATNAAKSEANAAKHASVALEVLDDVNELIQNLPTGGGGGGGESVSVDISAAVRMVAEGSPLAFNAHNGSMILCATTQNDAAFTDRTDATRYLIPVPANAYGITVETTDEKVTMMQFVGVKVNGSAYTKVFATERSAERSCEFEKGAADYIAINMIYEDTGAVTVPWDYDVTKTTTVAFSVSASGGLPAVTEADNDKLLQVVDGKWTVVALKDSSVKTYIDDYINEALGGEY